MTDTITLREEDGQESRGDWGLGYLCITRRGLGGRYPWMLLFQLSLLQWLTMPRSARFSSRLGWPHEHSSRHTRRRRFGLCAPIYPMGYQQITSLGAATTLTVPVGSTAALIMCEVASVRYRDDGTNPTASV
jgi:hypothetical protein